MDMASSERVTGVLNQAKENKAGDVLLVDKYNVAASENLARKALGLPITEAVPIYEQLLSMFPTAAKYWKQYVEAHMKQNNDDAAKQIFGRCLLDNRQVSLWHCYIRWLRKVNANKGAGGQEETKQAYEFMLNYVGSDIASGPVWIEYIAFLKSLPAKDPQEESQRRASIRLVYQKAIITPTHHVEQLWRDYENFENFVSRALAKGLVSEYQPKYNSARTVYSERKKWVDDIDWSMLAVPPTGSYKEEQQYMAWKRFLAFEKGNPQRIDTDSSNSRIILAYEQCLMYLRFYPAIWFEYASWHAQNGSIDLAVKVYQKALKVLPHSEVLRYAYAELEESRGTIQAAKKIYESLFGDGVNASALAHIQFIRFLRRTEGSEAAHKYFLEARKYPNCTYHVFVAYAMMKFCLDKNPKMARDVFEDGMKRFMQEPDYILEYSDFLCRLNDDKNVRALFERALNSLPPEKSVEVWRRYTQFEQIYGDLASMLKVEQRRREAFSETGEDGSLNDLVSRYSFMDLLPCTPKDRECLARQELLVNNVNEKVEKSVLPNGVNYEPRQKQDAALHPTTVPELPAASNSVILAPAAPLLGGTGTTKSLHEILKVLPPTLVAFVTHLPVVDGPAPDVDIVLSTLLQSNIPIMGDLSGANKLRHNQGGVPLKSTRQIHSEGKRKDMDRQQDDETSTQRQAIPTDVFRLRQMKKARGVTSSQTGSTSGSSGSSLSGELSGSLQ